MSDVLPDLIPGTSASTVILVFKCGIERHQVFRIRFIFLHGHVSGENVPVPIVILLIVVTIITMYTTTFFKCHTCGRHALTRGLSGHSSSRIRCTFVIGPSGPRTRRHGRRVGRFYRTGRLARVRFVRARLSGSNHTYTFRTLSRNTSIIITINNSNAIHAITDTLSNAKRTLNVIPVNANGLFTQGVNVPISSVSTTLAITASRNSHLISINHLALLSSRAASRKRTFLVVTNVNFSTLVVSSASPRLGGGVD